ncbi:MAG: tRNA-dihydrouridine synthase family protein [Desulfobulbaceae bacterium]|nr:tRNA-dihydrouridine synthase family protein [Desulfobulbaceae bacterium]
MVGITHSAFRSLVQDEGGVGLLFTEMLAAKRLPHDNELISPLLIRDESERPLIYQIIAANELTIEPAVEKLHKLGAEGIDLNLGCPAPVQRRQGAGAVLAGNHQQLRKVLSQLRKSTELPLSVKIRLGHRLAADELRSFCLFLEAEGVDMITIHARLNGEKFCRKPRWGLIGEVKDAVSVPILANGGIFSPADARKCLELSGADGLMIGRGAVEQPWLCADIAREIFGVGAGRKQREISEVYFQFITLLEQRFAPERRLGRLKQFTRYFAAAFQFGHHLAASIQNSDCIEQARSRATVFFERSVC